MATTNIYQTSRVQNLDVEAILKSITILPKLIDLGSAQGNWKPVPYANAKRDILRISIDEMQYQPNSISDNIFRRIGIRASSESINIQPLVLEIVESGFQERNIQDVIPMVLSKLNQTFDEMNAKTLKTVAKSGTGITWSCQPAFINSLLTEVAKISDDIEKVVVIPRKIFSAMGSVASFEETRYWGQELKTRLASEQTEILVSEHVGDDVFLIQKPLLAEYQGLTPKILAEGVDERTKEYWLQFILSGTDFKMRTVDAVQCLKVSSFDASKLSEDVCPQKKS